MLLLLQVAEQRACSLLQSCEEQLGSLKRIFLPGLAKQRSAYGAFMQEMMVIEELLG